MTIEEVEEAHLYLDELKVPRARDDNGAINSLKTRIEISVIGRRIAARITQTKTVDWKATAAEYRRMYETAVGADCEPRFAMTEAGKAAIEHTHQALDQVVKDHTSGTCPEVMRMGPNSLGCVLDEDHEPPCRPPRIPRRCVCGCTEPSHNAYGRVEPNVGCFYHFECKGFTYDEATTMRGNQPRR